jgi:hypothetical protein
MPRDWLAHEHPLDPTVRETKGEKDVSQPGEATGIMQKAKADSNPPSNDDDK